MDAALAQKFVDNDADGDVSIYQEYSGRGMFGNTTTGIVVPGEGTLDYLLAEISFTSEEKNQIKKFRKDNLGKQLIIY